MDCLKWKNVSTYWHIQTISKRGLNRWAKAWTVRKRLFTFAAVRSVIAVSPLHGWCRSTAAVENFTFLTWPFDFTWSLIDPTVILREPSASYRCCSAWCWALLQLPLFIQFSLHFPTSQLCAHLICWLNTNFIADDLIQFLMSNYSW